MAKIPLATRQWLPANRAPCGTRVLLQRTSGYVVIGRRDANSGLWLDDTHEDLNLDPADTIRYFRSLPTPKSEAPTGNADEGGARATVDAGEVIMPLLRNTMTYRWVLDPSREGGLRLDIT